MKLAAAQYRFRRRRDEGFSHFDTFVRSLEDDDENTLFKRLPLQNFERCNMPHTRRKLAALPVLKSLRCKEVLRKPFKYNIDDF